MSSYKITIEQIDEVTETPPRGEYAKLRSEYLSPDQYEHLDFEEQKYYKRIAAGDVAQYEKVVYGYLDPSSVTRTVKKEIFTQVVSELFLGDIVVAINGFNSQ